MSPTNPGHWRSRQTPVRMVTVERGRLLARLGQTGLGQLGSKGQTGPPTTSRQDRYLAAVFLPVDAGNGRGRVTDFF
jgi:hypothetical protein